VSASQEPPDWALPNWDAADRRIARPASTRSGPAGSGSPIVEGLRARILSVSDVTRAVKDALKADDRMRDVWVEGEVGRVTVSTAGHGYFSLQDERSQLACVFFRDDRVASPFQPQAGLRVVARGRIDVFDAQGVYQLYVSSLQPAGFGDLALRFEALKARLAAEGLFETGRKRPLPVRPPVVAVVTSPTGAVWHDIQQVITRRWPLTRVLLVPCLVQGDPAPASIVAALDRVGRWIDRLARDGRRAEAPLVTILARGGGSLEDLWPFNDEGVVRAVVRHVVPVVSGVGHEVDVTLADFAADVRAPTPSAAAELVTPDRVDIAAALAAQERRLRGVVRGRLDAGLREVAAERRALDRLSPAAQLAASRERAGVLLERATRAVSGRVTAGRAATDRAGERLTPVISTHVGAGRVALERAEERLRPTVPGRLARDAQRLERVVRVLPLLAEGRVATARAGLEAAGAALGVLGPQATLDRGYAIVRRARDGAIVRDPAAVPPGSALRVRVARGEVAAEVTRQTADDGEGR
jgi:exodeoxyribonuclease VII large subunit